MKGFAQATKDFEKKKLSESYRKGNPSESMKYLEKADEISYENINKDNEDQTNDEFAGRSVLDNVDETINLDMPGSDVLGSGKQLYNCLPEPSTSLPGILRLKISSTLSKTLLPANSSLV